MATMSTEPTEKRSIDATTPDRSSTLAEESDQEVDVEAGAESHGTSLDEKDPNVVDWEPEDPENPMNWPEKEKWLNIGILSGDGGTVMREVPAQT